MNIQPTIRIAIADDHTLVRNALIEQINKQDGFEAYIDAADGTELLKKIGDAYVQPDICLIDISMKGMDGYETMLQLTKKYPLVHGIALTMMDEEYSILRMMKNGAKGYLLKNINESVLYGAIREVYSTGFYFSDYIKDKLSGIRPDKISIIAARKMLTDKEMLFVAHCCSDETYTQIAAKMNISKHTACNYAAHIGDKLNIHSRVGLVMFALRTGIGQFAN